MKTKYEAMREALEELDAAARSSGSIIGFAAKAFGCLKDIRAALALPDHDPGVDGLEYMAKVKQVVVKWCLADIDADTAMNTIVAIPCPPLPTYKEAREQLQRLLAGAAAMGWDTSKARALFAATLQPEQPAQTGGVYLNQAQLDALREVLRISDREHEAWRVVKDAIAPSFTDKLVPSNPPSS